MKFKIYLFLLKCSLFCNQYYSVFAKAFVGQNVRRANNAEFIFVVSLKIIDNETPIPEDTHRCTGTLISVKDILTASHALEEIHLLSYEVVYGSVDLRSNLKRRPAWWINYQQWASFHNVPFQFEEDDIALIRLTRAVPPDIIYANLLPVPYDILIGENITVAGWGNTITNDPQRYMQSGELTVISTTECNNRINRYLPVPQECPENIICSAAHPFILSSPGDSGGPVLYMDLLVAVHIGTVPSILPRLHPDRVNVHLSIYEFADFLDSIVEVH